jgi:hypothetical protein
VVTTIEDEAQFDQFRAEEDLVNSLADITNAKYSAHYDRIVMAPRAPVLL